MEEQQAAPLALDTAMSPTIGKLVEALAKAQGEFEHAKKDANNPFFKSKYATLAGVIDAAKAPLSKNSLAVIQPTSLQPDGTTKLTTILAHSSGEWIRGEYLIKPVKDDPQGVGSAITYARRYAYSAITGIASDDDDGNAASGKKTDNSKISAVQLAEIDTLLIASGADKDRFLEYFGIQNTGELLASQFQDATGMLNQKKKTKKAGAQDDTAGN